MYITTMIIQKSMETRLDLTDMADLFDPNLEGVCLRALNQRFVGKCYKSCYVLKINKIIRTSQRYMSETLDGTAYVFVQFEVDGLIYIKGEIIVCKIIKIEAVGHIHATSQYAGVQVRQDPSSISVYQENQTVPFIVSQVMYNPNQDAISVAAKPFKPQFPEAIVYQTTGKLTDETKQKIQYLMDRVAVEQKKIESAEKKAFKFFQDLLYPYRDPHEDILPEFSLANLPTTAKFLYCPPKSKIPALYGSDTFEGHEPFSIQKQPIEIVIEQHLNQVLIYYENLQTLVSTYSTFQKVQEYQNIWRIYAMFKR